MRLNIAISGFVVLVGALSLASCTQRECTNYNDCPDNSICSEDGECIDLDPCPPEGSGTVTGRVTSPGGAAPIIGAEVEIVGGGTAVSGADGSFEIDAEPGQKTVVARRNDFFGTTDVEVCGQQDVTVNVELVPPEHSMAVVRGDYDSVEQVLQKIGLTANVHFDFLEEADLSDPDNLSPYRVLFLNCTSAPVASEPGVAEALQSFVSGGGRLYASDWAYEYVEVAWPNEITFLGEDEFGPKQGNVGETVATVNDASLVSYLGKPDVELAYDLGAWVIMESTASSGTALVSAEAGAEALGLQEGFPLLVQFAVGAGRVAYTTFHNEAQTTADMDTILAFLVFAL